MLSLVASLVSHADKLIGVCHMQLGIHMVLRYDHLCILCPFIILNVKLFCHLKILSFLCNQHHNKLLTDLIIFPRITLENILSLVYRLTIVLIQFLVPKIKIYVCAVGAFKSFLKLRILSFFQLFFLEPQFAFSKRFIYLGFV